MTRPLALLSATPDALGIRWAVCRAPTRTYLAWRMPDGAEGIEIKSGCPFRPARRVRYASALLCWEPLAPVMCGPLEERL